MDDLPAALRLPVPGSAGGQYCCQNRLVKRIVPAKGGGTQNLMGVSNRLKPGSPAKNQRPAVPPTDGSHRRKKGAFWRMRTGIGCHFLLRHRAARKQHLHLGEQKDLAVLHQFFIWVAQRIQMAAGPRLAYGAIRRKASSGGADPPPRRIRERNLQKIPLQSPATADPDRRTGGRPTRTDPLCQKTRSTASGFCPSK